MAIYHDDASHQTPQSPTFLEWLTHGKLATILASVVFIVVAVVGAVTGQQ